MKRQNFSKKREAILETLKSTDTHPTAEWVYLQLKSEYPDLSLGTVYRNLSKFKEDGTIISVGIVNGQERFDGNVNSHPHFVCKNCDSVIDIPIEAITDSLQKETAIALNAQVDTCDIIFHGICSLCTNKR